jgi:small subunit ribosomal protein S4
LARYRGSVCRICRRENMKLFLKGDRCFSDKCAFDRRGYAPGQHGQRRRGKPSDYGIQLREKQKVKNMYGLSEKQFRLFFEKADRKKGITGTNLLVLLERRLDNVVYRLGFANSRTQGRHFVRHNHFLVNGKRVNIPSFLVKVGDTIEVAEKAERFRPSSILWTQWYEEECHSGSPLKKRNSKAK